MFTEWRIHRVIDCASNATLITTIIGFTMLPETPVVTNVERKTGKSVFSDRLRVVSHFRFVYIKLDHI
jgi:hypothetical protein